MATGKISERKTKVGDVLKHEYMPSAGVTREEVTVTIPAGGIEVGAVLESTSVAGKYTVVAVATTANADAVLIDDRVWDTTTYAPGDHSLVCLVRGPAKVADESLTFNADVDTQNEKDAVYAALTANTGIVVAPQV
jgi:hypothetical protein